MDAQVWMTGRVGTEVDYRTQGDSPWATFRMACTPRVQRNEEWKDGQTTWVTVKCGNRLAQHVLYSLRKGDPVVVVGRLRTNRWHDANGIEHEQLQIHASSVGHDLIAGTSSFHRRPREAGSESAGHEALSRGIGADECEFGEPDAAEDPDSDREEFPDGPRHSEHTGALEHPAA